MGAIAGRIGLTAASLLVVEAGLRLLFLPQATFELLPHDTTATWRRAWVRRHADGATAPDPIDRYDPLRGWVTLPDLRREVGDSDRQLTTNSRGERGQREVTVERHPSRDRVVVLGDSFTFGEEVGDDQVWVERLAASLPGLEIVNLGVHGYGHDQMLLHLRAAGLAYRPDVVLVGYTDYDIARNLLEFRDYAKPRFVVSGGRLRLRGVPVPRPERVLATAWRRSWLVDLATMAWHPVARQIEARQLTWAIFDGMKDMAERAGASLAVVDLPTGLHLAHNGWKRRFVADYCAARGLDCVLLRPWVEQRIAVGEPFRTGLRHWDAAGHALVAEGVAETLRERGLVHCAEATAGDVPRCRWIRGGHPG